MNTSFVSNLSVLNHLLNKEWEEYLLFIE